jgi:hypothetical protein
VKSALQGEAPALLFSDLDMPACCVFCLRPRPLELCATWMCSRCKRRTLYDIFWNKEAAA